MGCYRVEWRGCVWEPFDLLSVHKNFEAPPPAKWLHNCRLFHLMDWSCFDCAQDYTQPHVLDFVESVSVCFGCVPHVVDAYSIVGLTAHYITSHLYGYLGFGTPVCAYQFLQESKFPDGFL